MKIQGKQQYLWRAVDFESEVADVFLYTCRDGKAAALESVGTVVLGHSVDAALALIDEWLGALRPVPA